MAEKEKYPKKLKNLVVLEGVNVRQLINVPVLKNKSPLCQIDSLKISLFDLPEHETVLITSEEKDLNYFTTATGLLQKWIELAENVIGFTILPKAEFKGLKSVDPCFMRAINSKFVDVKPLEPPNFITGLVAGVASYRKFKNMPFSCYIFYQENFDMITIKEILMFMEKLELPYDENARIRSLNQESNLYS